MRQKPFSTHYAFTLVELLIAMSLSSIVMVVLVGGFYMVTKNWETQETLLDNKIDNAMIQLELEKAIMGSFPYTYQDSNSKQKIFFKGGREYVYFISTFSPSYDNKLTLWQMTASSDGAGVEILVSTALTGNPNKIIEQMKANQNEENEPTIVFEGMNAEFKFLTVTESGTKNWLNSWDATLKKSLPLAVKIHLKTAEKKDDDDKNLTLLAIILANEHQTIRPK